MDEEFVFKFLNQNLLGCDLVFSFFTSAVNSLRSDSSVRPFPPMYFKEDGIEKDFNSLRSICNSMPPLRDLPFLPNMEKHIQLLTWLYTKCDPISYTFFTQKFNENEFPLNISGFNPKCIFKINHSSSSEQSWNARKGTFNTSLAFHGSQLDRFYSISRVGLQQIFSTKTNPLFGEGIYLSKHLSTSIIYAPYGAGWINSIIGENLSVVAVCEYIDDISKQRKLKDSRGSTIKGMIVVTDSDYIRVNYLLVFSKKIKSISGNGNIKLIIILLFVFLAIILYSNKFLREFKMFK
ncbi:protein mono-ADP-ribosyltransferase PARP16 [Onthophagus taurus]|uniref:protein mono-ADP-ribosyltransferase PARP16 n=1 Tax=Onthophagus taurus TaxID=166361 RepID=UPI0039BEC0D2